jgi:hypothetical protein
MPQTAFSGVIVIAAFQAFQSGFPVLTPGMKKFIFNYPSGKWSF